MTATIYELIDNSGIDCEPYFLAVAAAYGGVSYAEAVEQVHEDEDMKAVYDSLYKVVKDNYSQVEFEEALESIIKPKHYPL